MAHRSRQAKPRPPTSSSAVLPFSEVRDGVVVLNDGTLRSIMLVSSVNFALKSEDEQRAIVSGYISFLNALTFPLEIVVQSRKLNIDRYLSRLHDLERAQANELLRMQTADYRQFVEELLDLAEIMTKRFYVVVPYDPVGDQGRGFWRRVVSALSASATVKLREEKFRRYHDELRKRTSLVQLGLGQLGLTCVTLDTAELIELLYRTYNLELGDVQPLADITKLSVEP